MASHRVQQWVSFSRTWWIYDAKWQCPFQSSKKIVKYLRGQHKPIYHPNVKNVGDHVVVFNTKHIAMPDDRWRTWKHFHHTGYPGGFSATPAYEVHDQDPTRVLHKQIYADLSRDRSRQHTMARLHLYPEEVIPPEILKNVTDQIRQVQEVPRTLNEISQEEKDAFPALFEWPEDYVMPEKEPWKDPKESS